MGRQGDNIFGPFSGKVGHLVGATWRGIPILRTAPKKSSKPPSEAQLLQRAKFSAIVAFLQPLKPFLAARFGKREGSRSPFDLARSYHLIDAIKVVDETLEIILPKVCISKGDLRGVEGAMASIASGNLLTVQWSDNSTQSFAGAGDMLTVALYVPSVTAFYFFENIAIRQDTTVQITLPEEAVGEEVHCWATFVTQTGSQAAISCYVDL